MDMARLTRWSVITHPLNLVLHFASSLEMSKYRRQLLASRAATKKKLAWLLQGAAVLALLMYVLGSMSILAQWKDVGGKANENAPRLQINDVWRAPPLWMRPTLHNHVRTEPQREDTIDVDSSSDAAALASPRTRWRPNEFECLGWIETDDDGDVVGRRECWQRVRTGDAGYCEVRNASSGEIFRVMHTTRLSLKDDVRFTCELAQGFTEFRHLARTYAHDPPMAIEDHPIPHGIVIAVHERVLASAYASIRLLRAHGCALPIELWFRHSELARDNAVLQTLVDHFGPVTLRQIFDDRIEGFYVKAHALYYSRFANVLVLDADNFALRDPTFLFTSAAFTTHGAVFWPDFWRPSNTIFNVHAQSLLWELLGLDPVDMFEQESGQVLVNRYASRPMLELVLFFATHTPRLLTKLQLVWGDKDLFRLAWLVAERSFFYVDARMPGSVGVVNHARERFCGMSMAQYDLSGRDVLFLHRNTRKLTGSGDKRIWRVLQEYDAIGALQLPAVQSFSGALLFNETSCFGVKRFAAVPGVHMRRVESIADLATVEAKLIAFAAHAHALLDASPHSERVP